MKNKKAISPDGWAAVIIYSVIIVAFAQFNLDILVEYFMVSLGILLLPLFLTIIDDFPLMKVSVVAGLGVAVSRAATDFALTGAMSDFSTAFLPEAFFYIIYGLLLSFYYDKDRRNLTRPQEVIVLTFIDYVANMMELVLREGVQSYTFTNQMGIVLVGFVRAIIVMLLIYLFKEYKIMTVRQEDLKVYKKLVGTVTELSDEAVCMRENMAVVEDTMSKAYKLYNELKESGSRLTAEALSVATNVHEIKKSYNSVLRGVSGALQRNIDKDGMYVSEIISMLLRRAADYANEKKLAFDYSVNCPENLFTVKYYYLMSVFSNLFTNAVEAAEKEKAHIGVNVSGAPDGYLITVENSGKKIPAESIKDIFNAGYSTKIDYSTGVVGRGFGLFIVKDLVEKEFGGRISVSSSDEKTIFTIELPKTGLLERE